MMTMISLLFHLFYGYLSREMSNKIDKEKWFGNLYPLRVQIRMHLPRRSYPGAFNTNVIYKTNKTGAEIS